MILEKYIFNKKLTDFNTSSTQITLFLVITTVTF